MAKKKISQIAKEMGISSKKLIEAFHKLKISAKKVSDYVTNKEADKALDFLTSAPKKKVVKPARPKPVKTAGPKVKKKAKPRAPAKPKIPREVKVAPAPKPVSKLEEVVAPPTPAVGISARNLKPRPPIVTVMGHVDHGKTTLLDAIRQTNVAGGEAGQITQHIGAYEVDVKAGNTSGKIVFLDTPGHEAFTAMRARGTRVTDIVVLVVGADDGVMPQTIEAINHARAAQVPIVVAINKIDRETANPEQVKQQLSNYNLIPEDWGGETIFSPISALKKEGIDHLLEMILLQAEMLELKADPTVPARGTVIEARLDKHMGPVATVVIKEGTLRVGDTFIIGTQDGESIVPTGSGGIGKVRALLNDRSLRVKEAGPSTPIEVLGLENVPQAGEILYVITDKKILKEIEEKKKLTHLIAPPKRLTLEDLYKQVKEGEVKELKIVIKGDVQGSVEAITKGLEKTTSEEVKLQIIHKGVGEINEADIMLASASNTIVIGFNVIINPNARKLAQYEEVDVRLYKVIYDLLSDVKKALEGMLPPKFEEVIMGRVEVTTIFQVSKVGTIAGCRVTDGKVTRDARVKLLRKEVVIYEGKISSLKRFKEDAKEVEKGFECGLMLDNFNDIKEGDVIEIYGMQQVK
ncbi:hypothetical protein AUJ66_02620 [Candidatus Desantisbacteria bacterium CG1_02_38_46]|uniref:Translation initiation factor IF-2 n=1 Tax=Candidatus Desantisbacteria bacterium CG1_02_38_46 TaxID=1817893 RepID=A0A1J4SH27_9BACT|nr:MAG: hypothetical protein AUJ66_02620 [Candidatus Desantisbacteria bacterium CG1_02_38_46]